MHNRNQVLLICLINSQTRDAVIWCQRTRSILIQIQASGARHRGITRTRFDLLFIKDCSIHMGYHNGKCYRHDSRRCWCLNKKKRNGVWRYFIRNEKWFSDSYWNKSLTYASYGTYLYHQYPLARLKAMLWNACMFSWERQNCDCQHDAIN